MYMYTVLSLAPLSLSPPPSPNTQLEGSYAGSSSQPHLSFHHHPVGCVGCFHCAL